MQEKTNNRLITKLCRQWLAYGITLFIIAIDITPLLAQGMGSGMMGGMDRSTRNQNNAPQNDTPTLPKHQNPFTLEAPAAEGLETRTAALENFIFGSVQKKLPMKTRVERLEKKLVPYEHHKADESLDERIDHLWTMLSSANKSSQKDPAQ